MLIHSFPMNEVNLKDKELLIIASYTCHFFSRLSDSRRQKLVAFCSTLQNSTDCLKLEDLSDSRFQDRICIASQEKEESFI